jgi:poly(3-hydroxybutyrate) depolymerase
MEYERTYASLRCLVSVPPGVPPKDGWPVMVFLHGGQEAAPRELHEAMTAHGPLRQSSGQQATQRFIVVAPQLPAPGGNVWSARAGAVRAIAAAVAAEFGGDGTKLYLTGFSFGANGVLSIGSEASGFWAALWAVDPTQPPPAPIDRPMWVSAGERSRQNQAVLAPPAGQTGIPVRVYEDAGLSHVNTATTAFQTGAIYDWLLTHTGTGPEAAPGA